jgi:hypothetical protein
MKTALQILGLTLSIINASNILEDETNLDYLIKKNYMFEYSVKGN